MHGGRFLQLHCMPNALSLLLIVLCAVASLVSADSDVHLRRFFEGLDAGAAPVVAGQRLSRPGQLAEIYRERCHVPPWTPRAPLHDQVPGLVRAIEASTSHGLNGADHHHKALSSLLASPNADRELALELLATDAFLQQVRHRTMGAVSRELDPEWHLVKPEVDAVQTLRRDVRGNRARW